MKTRRRTSCRCRSGLLRCRALHLTNGPGTLLLFGEREYKKPMSNNAILGTLKRMGQAGRMTGIGFRGLVSTEMREAGFDDDAQIEVKSSHLKGNPMAGAYDIGST